jgi:hypothetical protein
MSDLTWSAAETAADAAETAGLLPPPPDPPPDPPPPVDSLSDPPPEYGPGPANSPKFSVMAAVTTNRTKLQNSARHSVFRPKGPSVPKLNV